MSTTHITGLKAAQLFESTRTALAVFNGSAVKKDSRVRTFLSAQFSLKNEHLYPSLFAASTPKSTPDNIVPVSGKTINTLLNAIESSSESLDDEIRVYRSLLRHYLPMGDAATLKQAINASVNLHDEGMSTENQEMHDFFHNLPGTICRECSTPLKTAFCRTKNCRYHLYTQDVDTDLVNYRPALIPAAQKRLPIAMAVETDNGEVAIQIDAADFFYDAIASGDLAECVAQLADQGLSCSVAADTVFEWLCEGNSDADGLLSYCHTLHDQGTLTGYQTTINTEQLVRFLTVFASQDMAAMFQVG
jgi:hypothetical protein